MKALVLLAFLILPLTSVEARISKGLKRPPRLVSYALASGTAVLTLNFFDCPTCLGTAYQLTNTGTVATSLLNYNLPFTPTTPGFDGEIWISSSCPTTLSAGNSCQIEVYLEEGGLYIGCITQPVTVTAGAISASANFNYGDCGALPPEI